MGSVDGMGEVVSEVVSEVMKGEGGEREGRGRGEGGEREGSEGRRGGYTSRARGKRQGAGERNNSPSPAFVSPRVGCCV